MRLMMTLIVFLMVSVTVAGAFVAVALGAPQLGLIDLEKFGWVAGAGFVLALPISYVIAGRLLKDFPADKN